MAILKLKPRHACEGRSITAVLSECIDYSNVLEIYGRRIWIIEISI